MLKIVPVTKVFRKLFTGMRVLKIVPTLGVCGVSLPVVVGVKNDTYVRSGASVFVGVKNSTHVRGA